MSTNSTATGIRRYNLLRNGHESHVPTSRGASGSRTSSSHTNSLTSHPRTRSFVADLMWCSSRNLPRPATNTASASHPAQLIIGRFYKFGSL